MHDRTWNQGLSGHVTGLRTGQSMSNSQSSEFVSIGNKGVMGCNTLAPLDSLDFDYAFLAEGSGSCKQSEV